MTCQNQVKFGTIMKQDEKNTKTYFCFRSNMLGPKPLFYYFLKYSFNYLTGKQFQTVAVKDYSRSASAYQKQVKSHCDPTGEKTMR